MAWIECIKSASNAGRFCVLRETRWRSDSRSVTSASSSVSKSVRAYAYTTVSPWALARRATVNTFDSSSACTTSSASAEKADGRSRDASDVSGSDFHACKNAFLSTELASLYTTWKGVGACAYTTPVAFDLNASCRFGEGAVPGAGAFSLDVTSGTRHRPVLPGASESMAIVGDSGARSKKFLLICNIKSDSGALVRLVILVSKKTEPLRRTTAPSMTKPLAVWREGRGGALGSSRSSDSSLSSSLSSSDSSSDSSDSTPSSSSSLSCVTRFFFLPRNLATKLEGGLWYTDASVPMFSTSSSSKVLENLPAEASMSGRSASTTRRAASGSADSRRQ
mmetsp:Transcript_3928/g.12738  ORF Transcript_3928/g.12738 Transcript_3928/m.12738 type:complete len:336 (+) Transcript_3928:41-1048(+)